MIGVTLDSSFYVGALNSRGRGSRLLDMARAGQIRIDISEPILTETIRVLREEFGWDGYRLNDAYQKLSRMANMVVPTQTLDVINEDPPDNRILECSAEGGSDYIITWDKDLLRLGQHGKAKIMRVTDFLREIQPGRERWHALAAFSAACPEKVRLGHPSRFKMTYFQANVQRIPHPN